MKSILIIGNGPGKLKPSGILNFFSNRSHSIVRKADWIIRFNDMKNFGGVYGTKTNALVLINRGRPAIRLSERERIGSDKLKEVSELWFSRPLDNSLFDGSNPLLDEKSRSIIDFQKLGKRKTVFISSEQYAQLIKELDLKGEPSSGICAIWLCQNDKRFADAHIFLDGFSWKGWSGHDWEKEKAYCLYLEKESKLSIL